MNIVMIYCYASRSNLETWALVDIFVRGSKLQKASHEEELDPPPPPHMVKGAYIRRKEAPHTVKKAPLMVTFFS